MDQPTQKCAGGQNDSATVKFAAILGYDASRFAIITRLRYRNIAYRPLATLYTWRFGQLILNRHAIQLAVGLGAGAMNRWPT